MRYWLIIMAIILAAAAVAADEIETASCIRKQDVFNGVIVSKIVADPNYNGRKWCYVYTNRYTVNVWVDELQAISCAEALDGFSRQRKNRLFQWMDGGSNPMFTDTVEREE